MNNTKTILKVLLTLILSFEASNLLSQTNHLKYTKWKLKKVEIIETNQKIIPIKHYYISFEKDRYQYNLEKNTCGGKYSFINKDKINFGSPGCTRVCCDGDISDFITYSGECKFQIENNILTLFYDRKIYKFEKILTHF
jgi:hypothetical protein